MSEQNITRADEVNIYDLLPLNDSPEAQEYARRINIMWRAFQQNVKEISKKSKKITKEITEEEKQLQDALINARIAVLNSKNADERVANLYTVLAHTINIKCSAALEGGEIQRLGMAINSLQKGLEREPIVRGVDEASEDIEADYKPVMNDIC